MTIISVVAGIILPNLTLSIDSQMSVALRDFAAQARATANSALLSGTMHRLVLDIKNGVYWTERPPEGREDLDGRRPPSVLTNSADNTETSLQNDRRRALQREFEETARIRSSRQMFSTMVEDKKFYSLRSIPVVQRKVLNPISWQEEENNLLFRRQLPGNIVFAQFLSELLKEKVEYELLAHQDKNEHYYVYIYFLPNGVVTASTIGFATKMSLNSHAINRTGLKYTLRFYGMTGGEGSQAQLQQGFVEKLFDE